MAFNKFHMLCVYMGQNNVWVKIHLLNIKRYIDKICGDILFNGSSHSVYVYIWVSQDILFVLTFVFLGCFWDNFCCCCYRKKLWWHITHVFGTQCVLSGGINAVIKFYSSILQWNENPFKINGQIKL